MSSLPCAEESPLPKVLVSILNWNASTKSIACVQAILPCLNVGNIYVNISLVDNGSKSEDFDALSSSDIAPYVALSRNELNLGFAGGHNQSIARAIREGFDYVWLLNNDAIAQEDCLQRLVAAMAENPQCGAMSPVILAQDDQSVYDFCGAVNNWIRLESDRAATPAQGLAQECSSPNNTWVTGTAALYRVTALADVGPLCEELFAYYEDNDICVRLGGNGWTSRMCQEATVLHGRHTDIYVDRPAYYFYLMVRNSFHFWIRHTPTSYRRWLRYRLACRGFILANHLLARGFSDKYRACLLGIEDGLRSQWGPPNINRHPVFITRLFCQYYGHRLYAKLETSINKCF